MTHDAAPASPGGVLAPEPRRARIRGWLAATNSPVTKLGVCNLCEAICGLRITVEAGAVTAVRGNPDDPLSRGHICPKGVAIADVHADPDRLRRPVRRDRSTGEWTEIGWDEAFDLVADRLAATINAHGRDAVGIYLGNPNVHSLGSMTHGIGLVKALRTRNTYSATSVDQLPHQLLAHLMFGHQLLLPVPDIDRTDHFLVVGANPMASNGSLMTVPDFPRRARELKRRGGQLVVLDPRRTETAKIATEHHFVRPGSDAWVLLAMLHVLFADGVAVAPDHADGLAAVEAAVADFTPERAAAMSGIPADEIRRLARELAAAESAVAYGRVGVSTHEFGSVCQWAVNLLNIVTGNLDREGGAMFTSPAIDVVGRGIIGRGPPRRLALPRPRPARDRGELPGLGAARGDRDARRGPGPGDADPLGQPGAVHARRGPPRRGAGRARLHGRGRHLPQRDHPARRRHPAAHHGAGARPLRPGLPDAGRAQHRPLHPGRAARRTRARGTTGRSTGSWRCARSRAWTASPRAASGSRSGPG